ncbi:MAG TPA: lipopolysaccharide biosynthesis protein [Candidatus Acidoferrales bacterium]
MPISSSSLGAVGANPQDGKAGQFSASSRDVRTWGIRSAASLVDQAFTSGVGLVASIVLARWMSPTDYGAFAVAFAAYLFLTVFHNALLLEPTSVIGPARHPQELPPYFRAQLRVHGILVWPLTGIALIAALVLWRVIPTSPLPGALAGGGLALPVLLLLWLARRMCYVLQKPSIAVIGSAVYFGVSLAALFALRFTNRITPANSFFVLGFTSLLGASVIFRKAGLAHVSKKVQTTVSWRRALRENWQYGRWLVGSALFYAIATSTPTFFVAGALSLDSAGVLRAMQIPSLVMTQIIASIGLLILPELSYDFGSGRLVALRRKAIFVGMSLGITALLFTLLLALTDAPVEHLLFSGKYAHFAPMIPLLAFIPVVNGFGTGYSMTLRACQRPHYDLISNAVAAIVSVVSTILLVRRFGVFGAALGMVFSFVAMNAVALIFFARSRPRMIASGSPATAVPSPSTDKLEMHGSATRPTNDYV